MQGQGVSVEAEPDADDSACRQGGRGGAHRGLCPTVDDERAVEGQCPRGGIDDRGLHKCRLCGVRLVARASRFSTGQHVRGRQTACRQRVGWDRQRAVRVGRLGGLLSLRRLTVHCGRNRVGGQCLRAGRLSRLVGGCGGDTHCQQNAEQQGADHESPCGPWCAMPRVRHGGSPCSQLSTGLSRPPSGTVRDASTDNGEITKSSLATPWEKVDKCLHGTDFPLITVEVDRLSVIVLPFSAFMS